MHSKELFARGLLTVRSNLYHYLQSLTIVRISEFGLRSMTFILIALALSPVARAAGPCHKELPYLPVDQRPYWSKIKIMKFVSLFQYR
jgi:hypothetical protein